MRGRPYNRHTAMAIVVLALTLLVGCLGPAPTGVPSLAPAPPATARALPATTPVPPAPTVTPSPTETPVPPAPTLPPLDGSAGGVIAYCYQPLTGSSLHQIYAINVDGSGNRRLIQASIGLNHHDWSPDAQRIAAVGYVDSSTWSIYVFGVDGSDLTRLTNASGVWDSEPSWSPDGTSIAFTRTYPDQDNREEIWVMNADGSDQHWIGVEGFAAKWSPDGSRFIYTSDRSGNYEIYTSNIDGTDEQQLASTSADESFPTWSPDGSQIAYSASTGEWNTIENSQTYEIYVMGADGTNVRQLTNNTAYDGNPRWSPDGSLLVYSSDLAETGHWEIYVMNADGSNVRQVTNTPANATAINPVWRPETPSPATPLSFEKSPQRFDPRSTFQVVLGDVDGDGDLDAVFSNMGPNHSQVWLNDGSGLFVDSGQELTPQGHGAGLGDLDGDGDLDLFISCASYSAGHVEYHKPSKVYLNDGTGVFRDSGQDLGDTELSGTSVNLIDIDTDGDLDACVMYYEQPYKVYRNDGRGTFAESGLTLPSETVLAWGDLDGDGDVDLFLKERGQGYQVRLNDGAGNLADHWQLNDRKVIWGGVALGDLDGDGDLDAMVANGDNDNSYPSIVLFNDGTGRFTNSGQQLSTTRWGEIGLEDLDGDGDLDAFITNFQRPDEVWLNDGQGYFRNSGLSLGGSNPSRGCAFGDLDADGDIDVFVASFGSVSNVIWLNGE